MFVVDIYCWRIVLRLRVITWNRYWCWRINLHGTIKLFVSVLNKVAFNWNSSLYFCWKYWNYFYFLDVWNNFVCLYLVIFRLLRLYVSSFFFFVILTLVLIDSRIRRTNIQIFEVHNFASSKFIKFIKMYVIVSWSSRWIKKLHYTIVRMNHFNI